MKFKKILTISLLFSLIFVSGIEAKDQTDDNSPKLTVTFPKGSLFRGILQQKISTKINHIGDKVELIIPADIIFKNYLYIPANSKFVGRINKLSKSKPGQDGYLQIEINKLIIPDGRIIDVYAHIWTKKENGVIGGALTKRVGYKKAVHSIAGIGDVVQYLPAGPRIEGKETELLPGSEWIISLDKELKLNIDDK